MCGDYRRTDFLTPEKSIIGITHIDIIQKMPSASDLEKAQEAIPHIIKGKNQT